MPSLHVRKVPREPLPIARPLKPGDKINLGINELTLGRDKRSGCWLPEHTVSKHHARITTEGNVFVIEDLESYNHTYVNDRRLDPKQRMPLRHGDEVRVCGYLFCYQEHDSDGIRSTVEASISPAPYPKMLEAQPSDKLRTLLSLGPTLNKTLDPAALLLKVAEELFELFRQADRCFVIELDTLNDELNPVIVKTRTPDPAGPFSSTIVRRCLETGEAFLSEDVTQEKDVAGNQSVVGSPMRSVMCVPIVLQNGLAVGVLQLDSGDRSKKFTRDDLQFLLCVASQVALALEFIQLHRSQVMQIQWEEDLKDAKHVQMGLLPQTCPIVPGYEFFADYRPARTVGGDYYDFIPLEELRLAVLLGDVAGKGLPAALLMARLSGAAQLCCRGECDLAAATVSLNTQLRRANLGDRYVTLTATLLDPINNRVNVVSAGHYPPWVYRAATRSIDEGAIPARMGGRPLGIDEKPNYEAVTVDLNPGDSIILFSDGILDAIDPTGRRFGRDRLREVIRSDAKAPPTTAAQLGERIIGAVNEHVAKCEPFDDISLVVFGRKWPGR